MDLDLDPRKQKILNAIVQDYIATAEPVGSQVLVERYDLGVKSATIRNEMAEMSDLGYLRQPHTSAGRVPSDRGYRFFVNRLMILSPVTDTEARHIQAALCSAENELDAILKQTCRLLTQMTNLPVVVTSPEEVDGTELRQIFVSPAAADKALLVLLLSTGRTEHRLLPELRLAATDALLIANALNERFGDQPLSLLRVIDLERERPPVELSHLRPLWLRLVRELVQVARGVAENRPVFFEGTQNVLVQPEFRDVERLGQFFALLQERAALLELLGIEAAAQGWAIQIGEEVPHLNFAALSVVSSPYFVGTRERGTIGVVGPTRMNYSRAVTSVRFMAGVLTELLTRLAVE